MTREDLPVTLPSARTRTTPAPLPSPRGASATGTTDPEVCAEAAAAADAALTREAAETRAGLWSRGFNRRTVLKAGMGIGVAALGQQLVTVQVAHAAPGTPSTGTLVVVFLRGGLDGLSVLVPADDPDLLAARPRVAVRAGALIALDRGFGLHPALEPLRPLLNSGRLAAVPAVATPDLSRSHFQAPITSAPR